MRTVDEVLYSIADGGGGIQDHLDRFREMRRDLGASPVVVELVLSLIEEAPATATVVDIALMACVSGICIGIEMEKAPTLQEIPHAD